MNRLKQIINEELKSLLKEYYDDGIGFDYYEKRDEIIRNAFSNFLYKNNEDFSKNVYWPVIPFYSIKKVWEDYIRYGFVKNEKFLEKIERIMINNVIRLDAFTYLFGHTMDSPNEEYEENVGYFIDEYMKCFRKKHPNPNEPERQFYHPDQLQIDFDNETGKGYKAGQESGTPDTRCDNDYDNIPYLDEFIDNNNLYALPDDKLREKLMEEMEDKFGDYATDPKSGHLYISDYGLKPLQELVEELYKQKTPEQRLVTVDKMLNVVHMRSDLASWFVEGGSSALSSLSGYEHDDAGELTAAQAEKNQ
jgi:hypothetical protein